MDDLVEFEALDYVEFARLYLERKESSQRGNSVKGSLAKRASSINKENTRDANRWASEIFNDIRRYLEELARKLQKKGKPVDLNKAHNDRSSGYKVYNLNGHIVQIKIYKIGSWANEEVPIVDIILSARRKIEINVYDDESIMVKLSNWMANRMSLEPTAVIKRVDRVGPYVNGILEKQLWR